MLRNKRITKWIFGALFGAWLGIVYALVSQAINWMFLPDIPLAPPSGSLNDYLFQSMVLGALLGLVCAIPTSRVAGILMGGGLSALLILLLSLRNAWGSDYFGATLILMLLTFMPLILLMVPLAFLVRLGVDAQQVDADRPYLWARRFIIPAALTLVAVFLGTLALYSKDQREALAYTAEMIKEGQQSSSEESMPEPLQDVPGFIENARGSYHLSESDRVDTFFGPRPAGSEMSQFLIISRFENGFTFACIFSANRAHPNCALYDE